MSEYPKLTNVLNGSYWAIKESALPALLNSLAYVPEGAELKQDTQARQGTASKTEGAIAIVPVQGIIEQQTSWLGMLVGSTSTEELGKTIDSLVANSSIAAIILNMDSPGGSVAGVTEVTNKIFNARGSKPIIAVANSMAASAAWSIATAADTVYVTPSGEVGSIGVWMVHVDMSKMDEEIGLKYTLISAGKYKTEGNSYEPLSEEAREYFQSRVDGYYEMFVRDVARNRSVSTSVVKKDYGQGRMFMAKDAKVVGMVDGVATLEDVIKNISTRISKRNLRSATIRKRIIEAKRSLN